MALPSARSPQPALPAMGRRLCRTLVIYLSLLSLLVTTLPAARPVAAQATGQLRVQYRTATASADDGEITPYLRLVNDSGSSVPLSELTIRYWYTVDGDTPQTYTCYYSPVGCANISGTIVKHMPSLSSADHYLELRFAAAAGSIGAGASRQIEQRINKNNWTNYNEANDYSYDASKTSYADWSRVTLYRNGALVWGVEPGGQGTSALKLEYKTATAGVNDGEITPYLRLLNTGSDSVPLSELTIRYWYTVDGDTAQTYTCYYSPVSCANISGSIVRMAAPVAGADHYLELRFAAAAGSIGNSSTSYEIQQRINKNNWTNYNEANDYSYDASKTSYADWSRVTLYRNGALVWGVEPGGVAPPTATATATAVPPTATATATATAVPPTATATATAVPPTATATATATAVPPTATPLADTEPPTVPANLRVTDRSADSISLAWDAATDNVGVTAYELLEAGTLLDTTAADGLTLSGLTPDSGFSFTVVARDAAGNRSAPSATLTTRTAPPPDTTVPTAPAGLRLTGSTDTALSLAWNAASDNVGVTAYEIYVGAELRATVAGLSATIDGLTPNAAYRLSVRALDAAQNRSAASAALAAQTSDGTAPTAPPDLRVAGRSDTSVALEWGAAGDAAGVSAYEIYQGGQLVGSTASRRYAVRGLAPATGYSFSVRALDAKGNRSASSQAVTATTLAADGLPDLPELIAPPSDQTVVSDLFADTAFLYTGPNPIQTGVAAGTINARRVAVLRGRVTDRDGAPLAGVQIEILGQPAFGQTLTRADGLFDLVVNGGGRMAVNYRRDGYLPLQRTLDTPWRDYAWLPEVVLTPLDGAVTTIAASAGELQVARANPVTDADGTRRATLLFPAGTTATMTMPNGSSQPLSSLAVRATEYTVGDRGPQAMPGSLPESSGYTYAVELSVDEALAAGASEVRFSQPVAFYLENFVGFPVGVDVPAGYYNREKAAWIAGPNGRVVAIVGVNAGLAELDIDGDGLADDGSSLGVTSAERQRLASLYPVGQTLWRVPIEHFTPWDCNWPYGPPDDADPPPPIPPLPDIGVPCQRAGSVIDCENQTLSEYLTIDSTPLTLVYRSDRVSGNTASQSIDIPISGATVPGSLRQATLTIDVGGRRFVEQFTPAPNQRYRFTWDNKDAYGRTLQGKRPVRVEVTYNYPLVYRTPASFAQSFARFGGAPVSARRGVASINVFSRSLPGTAVGVNNVRTQSNVGGWALDIHHSYDPNTRQLLMGDGSRHGGGNNDVGTGSAAIDLNGAIVTVAGDGGYGFAGDGGPATAARLAYPQGTAFGPDGSLYVADSANNRIRRIAPDGTISTVAGDGGYGFAGDGGPATAARLAGPHDVAVAPDGSLYIADTRNYRIRLVAPNGTISTVAGNGSYGFFGDEGPATAAHLTSPYSVAVAPDGSLYIADRDNDRIRRVAPNGTIVTVAGIACDGYFGCPLGDGGPAAAAWVPDPVAVALGPDGAIYVADSRNRLVRRIGVDGIITTVAGGGSDQAGSGLAALGVDLDSPVDVAVRSDGMLYVQTYGYIWRIADGLLLAVAGGGSNIADLGMATSSSLASNGGIALGAAGDLYIADTYQGRVRRVGSAMPGFNPDEALIAGPGGSELFRFDARGRHLATLDAQNTSVARARFGYDTQGNLNSLTDVDGLVTRLERNAAGQVVAVVGPYGHRTTFAYDANGYLNTVTNPADETTRFTFAPGGLMTGMTNPRGGKHLYEYDAAGRLIKDTNPAGGFLQLARVVLPDGVAIRATNALSHTTEYRSQRLSNGDQLRTVIAPNGALSISTTRADGTVIVTNPDGTSQTTTVGPDPRLGLQARFPTVVEDRDAAGNVFQTSITQRNVDLATLGDPLSMRGWTEQVVQNGRTTTTSYDVASRTLRLVEPAGAETVLVFDARQRPISRQATDIAPTTYSYNAEGRLLEQRDGLGTELRLTRFAYDPQGNLARVTDPLGSVTSYTYDAVGRQLSETWPTGQTLTATYDASGNLVDEIDARGVRSTYQYDLHDRMVLGVLDPGGRAIRLRTRYDLADNVIQTVDNEGSGRLNATTNISYTPIDSSGGYGVSRLTNPVGEVVSYSYTLFGSPRSVIDPLGYTTVITYNERGLPAQSSTPDGRTVTTFYNDDGQPVRTIDPRGGETHYEYDSYARLARVISGAVAVGAEPAINQIVTYRYDTNNRMVGLTDPRGESSSLRYDSFGRVDQVVDPLGNRIDYSYDPLNRLERVVSGANIAAEAQTTTYSYDASGRVVSTLVDGDGEALRTRYHYTRAGSTDSWNLQEVVDPRGNVTGFSYNLFGLLETVRDANGQTARYTYDNLGQLVEQRDPRGSLTSYTYDAIGRTLSRTLDGRVERWEYNDDGTIQRYLDFAGRATTYQYSRDRLTTAIDYPVGTPDVSFNYDANGNLTGMSDGLGSTSYAYDVIDRMRSSSRGQRTVSYGYNLGNQLTSLGYWGRGSVGYDYDAAGRLTSMTPWGATPTSYSYRSTGMLAGQRRGNGVATTYSYDGANRLTGLIHTRGVTTLDAIRYTLDPGGNRTQMRDSDGTANYTYDALNRLTSVSYPAIPGGPATATTSYGYDPAGNRTSMDGATVFSYDASDRISNPGYSYDANGNLLSDATTTYSYDSANRLVRTVKGGVTTEYGYDGKGNLVREMVGGATTTFVWDESGGLPLLLGEIRPDGTELLYAHGPEGFSAQGAVAGGTAQLTHYPLLDGQGSVRHLSDPVGALARTNSYDVFGALRFSSGTATSRLGYTGALIGRFDGTVYLRSRHYSPALGRFLQSDTFPGFGARPQSLNRYAYTENNPTTFVDPSGLFIESAAFVQGLTTVAASTATGAAGGSLIPGVGTVAGAIGGLVVGATIVLWATPASAPTAPPPTTAARPVPAPAPRPQAQRPSRRPPVRAPVQTPQEQPEPERERPRYCPAPTQQPQRCRPGPNAGTPQYSGGRDIANARDVPTRVQFEVQQLYPSSGRRDNAQLHSNITARGYPKYRGQTWDQAGHLVGYNLGGNAVDVRDNLVPMYRRLNDPQYQQYEDLAARLFRSGLCVRIRVDVQYPSNPNSRRPLRPTSLNYTIDTRADQRQPWTFYTTSGPLNNPLPPGTNDGPPPPRPPEIIRINPGGSR